MFLIILRAIVLIITPAVAEESSYFTTNVSKIYLKLLLINNTYICKHTHKQTHTHKHSRTHTHTHTQNRTRTHTHSRSHAHTHTHKRSYVFFRRKYLLKHQRFLRCQIMYLVILRTFYVVNYLYTRLSISYFFFYTSVLQYL